MYGNVGKVCRDKAPQHGLKCLQTDPMLGGEHGRGVSMVREEGGLVKACVLLVVAGYTRF